MADPFLGECVSILERTPATLNALLRNLPEAWTTATEGPGTWTPYDVIGHLIHGERVDWMVRVQLILEQGATRPFDPVDREAQFHESAGAPLPALLDEFASLRSENLVRLRALDLQPAQLDLQGLHPALGSVTLRQLLATWTAHDLTHLMQIVRVMGKRYRHEDGPWTAYLTVTR